MSFAKVTTVAAEAKAEDASVEGPQGQEQLFMSEKEKRKYLETEFQTTVEEYRKIIKRLEHADALP